MSKPEGVEAVIRTIGDVIEEKRARRAAAGVEVPPELRQPLHEWHGLVKDEARRRLEEETREQATES